MLQCLVLLCLALGTATAQNPCSTSTSTISDAAGASSLASACPTFTGDIALATGVPDAVAFDGLQRLEGSLMVENLPDFANLSSTTLQTITENLVLQNLTTFQYANFTDLISLGRLQITALPFQEELSFLRTLQTLRSLQIDNTNVRSIEGFSIQTISEVLISNNAYLETLNLLPYNITSSVTIQANAKNIAISMPNVEFTQNMTFRNASSISIPSLTLVNGSLGLYSNSIEEFNGAPLLKSIVGGFSMVSNTNLTRLAFPELESIAGGFLVINNSRLTSLDELYNLHTITGAIDFQGPFRNISFPALTDVRGAFVIGSGERMSCDPFDELFRESVIKGLYNCTTASDSGNSTTVGRVTVETATVMGAGGSSGGGLSGGDKAGIGAGVGVGGTLLVVGGIWLFLRRTRQLRDRKASGTSELIPEKDGTEIDRANMLDSEKTQKHELETPVAQLGVGGEAQELPAKHGETELARSPSTKAPDGIENRHEMPANETPDVKEKEDLLGQSKDS